MSVNSVVLIGRLTRDPDVRTTTSGKQVASFSIAVDRRFKGQDGTDVDFFRITAWGNSADFVGKYLGKGRLVAVEGRLQTSKYNDKDGNPRESVEVVAESVQGLDRPREGGESGGGGYAHSQQSAPAADEYDPFAD
jgi:single-strand DNA-binding protein